jgi:uncharacterized membrane protein YqaE (UPF0057 family)
MKRIATRLMALLILISALTPVSMAAVVIEPSPVSSTAATEPDPEKVKAAMDEFKDLSRREKRHRLKDAKKLFKDYKAAKKSGKDSETDQILLAILAILLPPLAVYLKEDEINSKFWISLILTLLFWIPGVIFALLVVFDVI